eukprot:gene1468-17843_t
MAAAAQGGVELVDLSSGAVAAALCDAMRANQTVVDADLTGGPSRNGIGDDGLVHIARGLRSNHSLQVLNLSANPFGD